MGLSGGMTFPSPSCCWKGDVSTQPLKTLSLFSHDQAGILWRMGFYDWVHEKCLQSSLQHVCKWSTCNIHSKKMSVDWHVQSFLVGYAETRLCLRELFNVLPYQLSCPGCKWRAWRSLPKPPTHKKLDCQFLSLSKFRGNEFVGVFEANEMEISCGTQWRLLKLRFPELQQNSPRRLYYLLPTTSSHQKRETFWVLFFGRPRVIIGITVVTLYCFILPAAAIEVVIWSSVHILHCHRKEKAEQFIATVKNNVCFASPWSRLRGSRKKNLWKVFNFSDETYNLLYVGPNKDFAHR